MAQENSQGKKSPWCTYAAEVDQELPLPRGTSKRVQGRARRPGSSVVPGGRIRFFGGPGGLRTTSQTPLLALGIYIFMLNNER